MRCRILVMSGLLAVAPIAVTAQTEWTLDPREPVLEPAPEGAWDHGIRLVEAVVKVDGVYHMFYRGQPNAGIDSFWEATYAIGHATSPDGIDWTLDPANPVLSPGTEGDWDHGSIRGAAVIHDGFQFRMWYASVTQSGNLLDVQWHGIGHATSTDGTTWSKSVENPIVRPGSSGTSAIPQTVIRVGRVFRMWYASSTVWTEGDLPAWSDDGLSWEGFTYKRSDWGWPTGLSVVVDGPRYLKMQWDFWMWDHDIWGAASPDGRSWSTLAQHQRIFVREFSPAVLVDSGNLVMWYSGWDGPPSEPGIYRATSTCCDTTYAWFVLAAASGPGASGSFYRTEVEINSAGGPAEYRFAWFPRDRDNSEWIRSGLYQLQPGKSMRYSDVLAEVFGLGPGSFGALAVEATSSDVLVAARISSSDGQTGGAYGQSIPVVGVGEFYVNYYSGYSGQRILFGGENAGERFNITCFSGAWWPDDVELELRDAEGGLLGTERLTLQPFGSGQVNRIFADHRPVEGYVQVQHGWGTYCFGSRIDNRTNDPTTILPR